VTVANDLQWGGETTSDERTWALAVHLSAFVVPVFGPLLAYLVKKDESPYIAYHALQAGIFQVVSWAITGATCGIGAVLFLLPIWIGIRAYNGEWAGYPLLDSAGRPRLQG
jgi:uncharacterized Tic20 family protein